MVSRSSFGNLLVSLTRALRRPDTEAHDLIPVIERISDDDSLIVISDMPTESWADALPNRPAIHVDIRQHNYGARTLKVRRAST